MRSPFSLMICALSAATLAGCGTTIETKKIDISKGMPSYLPDEGLYGYLGRTSVEVSFPVTLTAKWENPLYGKLDECLLACREQTPDKTPNKCTGEGKLVHRAVTFGVPTVSSRLVADPKHFYVVKLDGGPFVKSSHKLVFTPEGVISEAEASKTDHTVEFAAKLVKTVVDLAKPKMLLFGKEEPTKTKPFAMSCAEAKETYEALKSLPGEIKRLEGERDALLAGNAIRARPDTLKEVLARYDTRIAKRQETLTNAKAAVAPVAVEKASHTWTTTIQPEMPGVGKRKLTKFRQSGTIPVSKAWNEGSPEKILQTLENPPTITYAWQLDEPDLVPAKENDGTEPEIAGYRYRLPAPATLHLKITGNGKENIEAYTRLHVAQFGPIASLQRRIPGSGGTVNMKTHDHGGLKEASIGAEPVSTDTAASFLDSAASYIQAGRDKRAKEKEAAANAQLNALKNENAILEETKKNRDLRAELGLEAGAP